MITVTKAGMIAGEYLSVSSFVINHFKYRLNESRQLELSGTPFRYLEQKTKTTAETYSEEFTAQEAAAHWATSKQGRKFLAELGLQFFKEI